jgi:hypothetical protein
MYVYVCTYIHIHTNKQTNTWSLHALTHTAPAQTEPVSKETYYKGKRDLLNADFWEFAIKSTNPKWGNYAPGCQKDLERDLLRSKRDLLKLAYHQIHEPQMRQFTSRCGRTVERIQSPPPPPPHPPWAWYPVRRIRDETRSGLGFRV